MKIVLNNQEMKAMEELVDRYLMVLKNTYAIFDVEESCRVSSTSKEEVMAEVKDSMPWFNIEKIDEEGCYHLDVDSKLFALYLETVNKSMEILDPYHNMAVMTTFHHRESLIALPSKFEALKTLINKPMVMKGVTFVCNMLGIKDYVFEMIAVGERMLNNKVTKSKLEAVQKEFSQGVLDVYSLADMGDIE